MKSLSILRQKQHQSIRKCQLLRKFQCQRNALQPIQPSQSIVKIQQSLNLLKAILIDSRLQIMMAQCLATIHNLADKYLIIDMLMKDVRFDAQLDSVKNGDLPVECCWIQIFLIIINQDWSQDVNEQCSGILSCCTYQLRLKLTDQKCKQNKEVDNMVENIVYTVPFSSLMRGCQYKIIQNLLQLLQQLLTMCESIEMMKYLLQMSPNILQLIMNLSNSQNLMALLQIRQVWTVTSIMLIFNILKFKMQLQAKYQLDELINCVKSVCLGDFLQNQNRQRTHGLCLYLQAMSKTGVKLTNEQFLLIESTVFEKDGAMQSIQFLELMNVLMYVNKYALTNNTTPILIENILKMPEVTNESCIKIKQKQLIILKRQIDNTDQVQSILNAFETGEKTSERYEKLVGLIKFAQVNSELSFNLLMELVWFLLSNNYASVPHLVKNQLFALTEYSQFRLILDELANSEEPQ